MKFLLISAILASSVSAFASSTPSSNDLNKKLVTDFYDLAFNKHHPTEAANSYIGTVYIQHNPNLPDGAAVFSLYFEGYFKTHPNSRAEIKRVIAEGDLVVLHVLSLADDQDRGNAVVDIFRVKDGKIVEHWDVTQPVPETSANLNTVF